MRSPASLIALCGAALVALAANGAAAAPAPKDAYPNKPVRMVIPFAAGGFSDVVGRIVTQKLSEQLGQPVVADNRPGASGIIGSEIVARAVPDGYTLLLNSFNHVVNPSLMRLPYDPIKGFTVISMIAGGPPLVMMVNPSSPIKSVQDLISLAKKRPGHLNYASSGIGTSGHLIGELFKLRTGVDIVHVAYKGSGASMTAIVGGEVNMASTYMPVALPQVQSGKLRALALTGAKRWKGMPDVPTMQEAGFKGYNLINWFGLWLPANASPALMARLHAEVVKVLADPEIRQQFDVQGLEGVGSKPEDFAKFVAQQSAFMTDFARKIETTTK